MKIIFNYLPPGNIDYTSPSFSILQSFLDHNGYKSKTIFWNILMFRIMSYYANSNDILRNLFPFLDIIAEEYNDNSTKKKLGIFLQTLQPHFKTNENFYRNSADEIRKTAYSIIQAELDKKENEAGLFGISAKFYQWIPGSILAKEIKKKYPESKIVIGGLTNKDAAVLMMKRFPDFDYAIWGEGEYPLLELCNYLEKKDADPANIPRLVLREGKNIKTSTKNTSRYLDFNNYIFPDNTGYFEAAAAHGIPKENIKIMVHTVGGCRWNRCNFCNYTQNKVFRERTAENIFEEIKLSSEKYGVSNFYFADNDIIGKDIGRFENLLDLLIDYKKKTNPEFRIYGEMIPTRMITTEIIGKMALAGFNSIFIGYEAVTDKLLRKMDKENTFSENILFVKSAIKYGIKPQVNIINGIPSETADDVVESINNLHFLRFYYNNENADFSHNFSTLNLYEGTEYFRMITEGEKDNFDQNPVTKYLPQSFIEAEERFNFFSFRRNTLKNYELWTDFAEIEAYYKRNKFSYDLQPNEKSCIYREFINGQEIKTIEFDSNVFYEILSESNAHIVSFDSLHQFLLKNHPDLTADKLKDHLIQLKNSFLVYFDDPFLSIVSVIDLDKN